MCNNLTSLYRMQNLSKSDLKIDFEKYNKIYLVIFVSTKTKEVAKTHDLSDISIEGQPLPSDFEYSPEKQYHFKIQNNDFEQFYNNVVNTIPLTEVGYFKFHGENITDL